MVDFETALNKHIGALTFDSHAEALVDVAEMVGFDLGRRMTPTEFLELKRAYKEALTRLTAHA